MSEALALVALAACLAAAVARVRWAPDWAVGAGGAALLVGTGILSAGEARSTVDELGPTVGFLAALLLLADGCRRAGVFEALGAGMALGARGQPRRLLALVFAAAAATTAVLSLDATVILLTPIVFATAARLYASARPHVYACSHLANTASLLLPVSNLTNLLAFHASRLSFTRFAALMVLPWLAALTVEWLVLSRSFTGELQPTGEPPRFRQPAPRVPAYALSVLALTLAGFAVSSPVGIDPAWIAAAGALALAVRERPAPRELVAAVQPTFLIFVLALGIVVSGASRHGLASVVDQLIPAGHDVLPLLAVAAVSALLANLVNNLPATLIILPVAASGGAGTVLAMLLGVNIGPNLTYVGSLATLLWRRIVHAHEHATDVVEFTRLGALTVSAGLLTSTAALWLALQVV